MPSRTRVLICILCARNRGTRGPAARPYERMSWSKSVVESTALINIGSRYYSPDLSTCHSSLHIPRGSRDDTHLDSRPEKIQLAPSRTDTREWLAATLSHQCPQDHFHVLRADLCGTHRYNRSECRRRGLGVNCHDRNKRHD